MSFQLNGRNILQNNQKPQMNTTFKANPVATTNTLERTPTNDTLIKPTQNKTKKTLLTLGGLALAGVGIFAAVKAGKAHQQKKAIQEIEKKFADLQNDMPRVQKTFKEVFLREDLTEKEALEMLNRYKEVEKIRITGTKKDYARAVFEEGKKNYRIHNSDMKITFANMRTDEYAFGGCPHTNSQVFMTDLVLKTEHSTIFEVIHHELRHAKQNELMYHYNPDGWIKNEIYGDFLQEKFSGVKYLDYLKEVKNKIGSCDLSEPKVRQYLEEELNLTQMLEKTFGKPSLEKIPKIFEESVKKLNKEISTSIPYTQRFEEIDAFEAGKKVKDLICYK